MAGPSVDNPSASPKFLDIPLWYWFTPNPDLYLLGHVKPGHLVNADDAIFPNFPSYWDDFKPFVRLLLKEFFPSFDPLYSSSFDAIKIQTILEGVQGLVSEPPTINNPTSLSNVASHDRILQSVVMHSYLSNDMCMLHGKHKLDDSDYHPTKRANTGDGLFVFKESVQI
jgi:hypothetical protein